MDNDSSIILGIRAIILILLKNIIFNSTNGKVICGNVDIIISGLLNLITLINLVIAYLKFLEFKYIIFLSSKFVFKGPILFCITNVGLKFILSRLSTRLNITFSA